MESNTELSLPVTSPETNNLLESFKINVPEDQRQPSFAKTLLTALQCHTIEQEIHSLSNREVVLDKNIFAKTDHAKPEPILYFEVEVICTKGTLNVNEKDAAKRFDFFRTKSENALRVIWINSRSVNVIDAKLAVYRRYEYYLKEETIYLHHALENDENIVKMSAYRRVNSFDTVVNSISQSIPIESVETILQSAFDKVLSRETISGLCYGIFLRDRNVDVGTIKSPSYSCYSKFRVSRLKEELVRKTLTETAKALGSEICRVILKHIEFNIQTSLGQTFEDLTLKISDELFEQIKVVVVAVIKPHIFPDLGFVNLFLTIFMIYFGSVDVNSRDWRRKVADEIYETIHKSKADILRKTEPQIKEMCKKTVQELQVVSNTTTDFKRRIGQTDQKELVLEWKKRNVFKNSEILKKLPSVQTYIAGTRDGVHVVKVFLSGDDKTEAKVQLRKHYPDVPIEFVDVDTESDNILKNMEKIKKCEQSALEITKESRKKMNEVIQSQAEKVFANHSSIIGIEISNVRSKNNVTVNEFSIVLLCLDESIVPFGESPLPKSLGDYPCDVRKEFVLFGHCDNCQTLNIGCSIGIPSVKSAGSVGFFVRSIDTQGCSKNGFLTAAHVAIEHCNELYENRSLLSAHSLAEESHTIVHPSYVDNTNNIVIGEVIESFIGNFGPSGIGIDAAFVQTNQKTPGEEITLHGADENSLAFNGSVSVKKVGRATGKTVGKLVSDCLYVRVYPTQVHETYYEFQNCFAVEPEENGSLFFDKGDSGSGVFVIDKKDNSLKPLGIAFAFLCSKTAVCKIGQITDAFNVSVYEYEELMDTT